MSHPRDKNGNPLFIGALVVLIGKVEAIKGPEQILFRPGGDSHANPLYIEPGHLMIARDETKTKLPSRFQIGETVSVPSSTSPDARVNGTILAVRFTEAGIEYEVQYLNSPDSASFESIEVETPIPDPVIPPGEFPTETPPEMPPPAVPANVAPVPNPNSAPPPDHPFPGGAGTEAKKDTAPPDFVPPPSTPPPAIIPPSPPAEADKQDQPVPPESKV